MDYAWHYDRLVSRARGRVLHCYTERHHVVPKSMGGSNSADNIVRLTPEEHYVAHQLLVKMYPGDWRILWAASNMTGTTGKTPRQNKLYGWLRRRLAASSRKRFAGKPLSEDHKQKLRLAKLGTKQSAETIAKRAAAISKAKKGMVFSDKRRKALSEAKLGKKRGPHSPEHRAKISESCRVTQLARDKAVYRTAAYRELQSRKAREVWALRRSETLQP